MMLRRLAIASTAVLALSVILLGTGCGSEPASRSAGASRTASGTAAAVRSRAHPQAVEPTAGVPAGAPAGAGSGTAAPEVVGDPNAHAPSLAQVKRELKMLNLCGGVTDAANARPVVSSRAPGFVADPGTNQGVGQLPVLTARLDQLGKALGITIYGISGYRTPAHSVAVGGFANDPHTQGLAEDIGVGSLLRSSAAQISEAELARFGLYRPFDPSGDPGNTEVNHIQMIPAGGPVAPAVARWDPDPACR